MKNRKIMWMCESAVMVALGTVLSMVAIINMPFGGSVTAASMVPVMLIAYRYGVGLGSITGLVYAIIQLLLGANNLSYATSSAAAVAIIMLDYLLAFTCIGLSGAFKGKLINQSSEAALGGVVVCAIRYVMHVISGCTVWAGVSIPTEEGLIYSLAYNAAYMVPETIVTVAAIWYLTRVVDFRAQRLGRVTDTEGKAVGIFNVLSVLALVFAGVFLALMLFAATQTEEGFNIAGITSAPLGFIGIVVAVLVLLSVAFYLIGKRNKK